MDELEAAMAAIAAEVMGLPGVGGTANLTELGANSMALARIAGRLHDELPAVSVLSFDAVLRELLNEPTVAAVAALVRAAEPAGSGAAGRASGNARMVPMGGTGEPMRVLIHAGPGTVDCYRPLAARLAAQDLGTVMGIAVADLDTYCAIPPAEVIPRCADEYAARLLDTGHRSFQMIGYCVGGIFSVEVALRLLDAGARIVDFTLIDSLPAMLETDDELMIEATFLPDLGLPPTAAFADVDAVEVMRAYLQVAAAHDGYFPADGFASVGGDPGLDAVRTGIARLTAVPQAERLAGYATAMMERSAQDGQGGQPVQAGTELAPDMVPGLYRMYRQSFLASQHEPPAYPGDIHYLRAESPDWFEYAPAPLVEHLSRIAVEDVMDYWRRVCAGTLTESEISGDHMSCVEEPHAAAIAEHLGAAIARHTV